MLPCIGHRLGSCFFTDLETKGCSEGMAEFLLVGTNKLDEVVDFRLVG